MFDEILCFGYDVYHYAKYHWNMIGGVAKGGSVFKTLDYIKQNINAETANYCFDVINTAEDKELVAAALEEVMFKSANEYRVKWTADCFRKLPEYTELIDDHVYQNNSGFHHVDDLASDKACEAVKASKNPEKMITDILKGEYYAISGWFPNYEDHYEALSEAISTLDQVLEVHKNRDKDDRKRIIIGFYDQLQRAIEENGIEIIKQYCSEVRQKVRDNALELMVITNA